MKNIRIFPVILLTVLSSLGYAQDKKIISSSADLPQHSYTIPAEKANDILGDTLLLNQLIMSIKKDLTTDLQLYDFRDKATLRDYYYNLRLISFLEKDYKASMEYLQLERNLADKEAEKLVRGREMEALVRVLEEGNELNSESTQEKIKTTLVNMLKTFDFSVIQENIQTMKGYTDLLSENFIRGILNNQVQPVIDNNNGTVPLAIAEVIPSMYYSLNYYLPIKEAYRNAYDYLLRTYGIKIEIKDIWKERNITLSNQDNLNPVVVGIWDTGVDTEILPENNQWRNKNETRDNKDNDNNGFIDDIFGIGYDIKGEKSIAMLEPDAVTDENIKVYQNEIKGLEDILANIDSPEASELKRKLSEMDPQKVNVFLEKLGLFGIYAHGTHVAGIVIDGNPAAKILNARISFDYHTIPFVKDEQAVMNCAEMYKDVITYFKSQNVKVVNMSWTVGIEDEFMEPMRMNGVGANDSIRMEIAKKLFDIERKAYIEAVSSATDILFVCAAGNDNDDVDFTGNFPASLNLPNIITVGAVDSEGKKTSFTTEGKSVDLYANGFEVESYVPGGDRIKFSGTSMASPQVVNLAAKLWALNPKFTVEQVKNIMIETATPFSEGSALLLVHPAKAVEKAKML